MKKFGAEISLIMCVCYECRYLFKGYMINGKKEKLCLKCQKNKRFDYFNGLFK